MTQKITIFGILAILILLILSIYFPVVRYDFVYDDTTYVLANPFIRYGLTWDGIKWAFAFPGLYRTIDYSPFWRPLTYVSHMLDAELFGLWAGGHHISSVLFHILNTIILFFVLKKMTKKTWQSALVTALFAIHPLQIESVGWVSARNVLISALLGLLTMWFYLQFTEKKDKKSYAITCGCFALMLMSKSDLIGLPVLLLVLDYWPLRRISFAKSDWPKLKNLIAEKWCLFIIAIIGGVVAIITQPYTLKIAIPFKAKIMDGLPALVFYAWKVFFPVNLTMYPNWIYPSWSVWNIGWNIVIGAGIILAIITFLAIRFGKLLPFLFAGWGWYLLTILPASILPQPADRYMYIPMIGIWICLIWSADEFILKNPKAKKILVAAFSTISLILFIKSCGQIKIWRDGIALYGQILSYYPNHYLAHVNLANLLASKQRYSEALDHYRKAIELGPHMPIAYENLGVTLIAMGALDQAKLVYEQLTTMTPDESNAYAMLGLIEKSKGNFDQAISYFHKALTLRADDWKSHMLLGTIYEQTNQFDLALASYNKALQINNNDPETHYHLSNLLARMGRREDAILHRSIALKYAPELDRASKKVASNKF